MALDIGVNMRVGVSGQDQVDKLAESLRNVGKTGEISAGQTAQAFRMLPAQMTDIATQLAGGQNPFLVLLQQGGQIKDMFGGFGAMFRGLATLITPFNVAIAAAAASVGTLISAYIDAKQEASEFAKAMALTGNTAAVTRKQMEAMAQAIESSTTMTIGDAKELVQAAVATGAFTAKQIEPAVMAMARYRDLSGETTEKVVQDFAALRQGSAQWAASHNEKMNFLTEAQFNYIRSLEQQGKTEEAVSFVLERVGKVMRDRTEEMDIQATFLERLKKGWSEFYDILKSPFQGGGGSGRDKIAEELARETKRLAEMERDLTTESNAGFVAQVQRQRAYVEGLKKQAAEAKQAINSIASPSEKDAVKDTASGLTDRKAIEAANAALIEQKRIAADRLANLTDEQAKTDQLRERGLINQIQFIKRTADNEVQQLAEQKAIIEKQKEVERAKFAKDPAAVQAQKNALQQYADQIDEIDRKIASVKNKAALETTTAAEQLARMRTAKNLEKEAVAYQTAGNIIIAEVQRQKDAVQSARAQSLISEQEYVRRIGELNVEELKAQRVLAQKQLELANQQPAVGEAAILDKQVKISQKEAEIITLNQRITTAAAKGQLEYNGAVVRSEKDLQNYAEDLQFTNDMLRLQGREVFMATEAYKLLVEQKQREREINIKTRDMAPEQAAAYRKIAEAAGEAKDAIMRQNAEQAKSWATGAKEAMKEYVEDMNNAAAKTKQFFAASFKSMEDAMIEFVKTGKVNFSNMADSIINDLIRIAVQRQILGPLMGSGKDGDYGILGGVLKSAAGFFGFSFANGGIMSASGPMPLNTYASGGIANSPQLALFGEGRTPEAFVPLPDGRSIPVSMRGNTGGSNVIVNVVNNASGAKATAQERQDGNGQRIIDVMIEQVKASIAADISRGTGTVTSALERTYGANRAAGAY